MNRFLVIGLGSMGKRRIRCLMKLGVNASKIYGYDVRIDRCIEAKESYGINILGCVEEMDFSRTKAIIVSLPPDKHFWGVGFAEKHNIPVFVEASVVLDDVKKIKENNTNNIFIAPSATFRFHPMIKLIRKIVADGRYGKVCNFSYHSGQYLPDWHPWEKVTDYYVGNRNTGGAREIVPYELTWMVEVFGFPMHIKGYYRKTIDLGCDIEDSYSCCLEYEDKVGTLLVDVVSRFAVRNLIINFEYGQIQWRWDKEKLEIYDAKSGRWEYIEQEKQVHEDGYNANIGENMYIDEIKAFLDGIDNSSKYPNSVDNDIRVLELLEKIESV